MILAVIMISHRVPFRVFKLENGQFDHLKNTLEFTKSNKLIISICTMVLELGSSKALVTCVRRETPQWVPF